MKRIHKLIAFVTAGLLIVGLAVYTIVLDNERQRLKNYLSAQYTRAFDQLLTDVSSLEAKLYKLEAASGTNQHSILLMDVWRQAGDTESAISALPVSYTGTGTLMQYVNRTGDYCRYLSRKIAQGEELSEEDFEQIRALGETCNQISVALDEAWRDGSFPGDFGFAEGAFMLTDETGGSLDFANQEFPRLMYDGPFSESTENKDPEGLTGSEMTREQAAEKAAVFMGVTAAQLADGGECFGDIPSYMFSGQKNGGAFNISITKKGGHVLWFMFDHNGGISAVPTDEKYEQLTKAAQQFVRNKGYGDSAPSYAQFYNGLAIINLAPMDDDIVLYPDLIKVWVDIATGRIMGFDANNYLMSHKKRSFDAPVLTKQEAQEKINGGVQVQGVRLALIPLESGQERLCWEFTGSYNGHDYIIYINVQTGVEEDIMIIQHTNDGTLVM